MGGDPLAVAVNPVTNTIYVTCTVNGRTNTAVKTFFVGNGPSGIAVSPVTNTVYVANSGDGTVSVLAP